MIANYTKLIPTSVPISGRRHDLLLKIMDLFVPRSRAPRKIDLQFGEVFIDPDHNPQRFLGYFYFNLLRYYEQSPLGHYIKRSSNYESGWFVDAGANLGVYSIIAKSRGYRTLLVEPEPKHSSFLERNSKIFDCVKCVAVSESEGSLPLYMEKGNPGSTSLVQLDSYEKSDFEVPVKNFSDILFSVCGSELAMIKLIKIDVEGYEAFAVRGLSTFLEKGFRPDIWCEVRGMRSGRNGGSFKEVSDILMSYGYSRLEFSDGAFTTPTDADCTDRGVFDLLFATKDSVAEKL